jgi:hypothetical protein
LLDPKMHAAKMDVLLFINKCLWSLKIYDAGALYL